MKYLIIILSLFLLFACNSRPYKFDERNLSLRDNNGNEILTLSYSTSKDIRTSYKVNFQQNDIMHIKWIFEAEHNIPDAHIIIDVTSLVKSSWWLLPAVSYNGNNWGKGSEPKGARDGENGWWTYSYRRSPIPGSIYSENAEYAIATWCGVPKCAKEDFSYSIMPEEDKTTHRYIWPEEEMPRAYTSRDVYSNGWQKKYNMQKSEVKSFDMYISINPTEKYHRAISHFMKSSWNMADKVSFTIPDNNTLWNYGIRFAKESLWDPTEECIGFRTGLLPDYGSYNYGSKDYGDSCPIEPGNERKWRKVQGYAGGWCGRNINIGCAMLADYILKGNKESLEIGLATLDHWAHNAPCPSGLIRSGLPGGNIDACNMGTEVLGFMNAYKLTKKCGIERPEYMQIAIDACKATMATQREDGCYARSWSTDEEGKPTSYDGFTSTYMINPMLESYKETKEECYLLSAEKAYKYFIGEFNRDGFTTAGALDTHCIDKESSIPLFDASIALYELSKEQEYLDDALALGYYISSWLWCYDGVYPSEDCFTKHNFHTFGGTSVSTQHQCLDNFGLPQIPGMRKLTELTGDNQWKEKADAMYHFSCQLISDGEFELNGRIRPVGGQSEAYFQAEWYLYGNKGRFDNWLVAWPNVMRLEYQMHEKSDSLGLK